MTEPSIFRAGATKRFGGGAVDDVTFRPASARHWLGAVAATLIVVAGTAWAVTGAAEVSVDGQGMLLPAGGLAEVVADIAGTVVDIDIEPGQHLAAGATVVRVRDADGAVREVLSVLAGKALSVDVQPGGYVSPGTIVAVLDVGGDLVAHVFVPLDEAKAIRIGMPVRVEPSEVATSQHGSLVGTVTEISPVPLDDARLATLFGGDTALIEDVRSLGPTLEVVVALEADDDHPTGYRWTGSGPSHVLTLGSPVSARVVLDRDAPIDHLL